MDRALGSCVGLVAPKGRGMLGPEMNACRPGPGLVWTQVRHPPLPVSRVGRPAGAPLVPAWPPPWRRSARRRPSRSRGRLAARAARARRAPARIGPGRTHGGAVSGLPSAPPPARGRTSRGLGPANQRAPRGARRCSDACPPAPGAPRRRPLPRSPAR